MMKMLLISTLMALLTHVGSSAFAQSDRPSAESRIHDPSGAFSRIDIERIAFAIQDLEEEAEIESRVQILEKIEDEIPRPLTAKAISIVVKIPEGQVRVNVGSELQKMFSESRVNAFVTELLTPAFSEKRYADGIVELFKRFKVVGAVEGGVTEHKRLETGKSLAIVIAICSAVVLMFLWMLLFMNRFIGAGVSLAPFMSRIVTAHAVAVIGIIAAYVVEIQLGLGLIGMLIIPIVFIVQMFLLFRVFATVLPAVGRG